MPKDIRKVMKDFKEEEFELSQQHKENFINKLNKEFPTKKKSHTWLYAVASVVILIGIALKVFLTGETEVAPQNIKEEINLGKISPEMKKIENYYLTAINYEMAELKVTPENKALLDEYLEKISKLDVDYKRLNKKLTKGINTETINALITNLQLRLQLLIQLKDQVNELQTKEKNNENNIL